MKEEKHIYTVYDNNNNGQVYQIEVIRDNNNNIQIKKMFIMILVNGTSTKIMLNMDAILEEIKENPNQQVNDILQELCDEEFTELEQDINNENNKVYKRPKNPDHIDINSLLKAAEKAKQHSMDYDDIIASIDDKLNELKKSKKQ